MGPPLDGHELRLRRYRLEVSNPHRTVRCGHSRQVIAAYHGPMRVSKLPSAGTGGVPASPGAASACTRAFQTPKSTPSPTATPLSQSVLAPPPPPGDSLVIPILDPAEGRHQVQ